MKILFLASGQQLNELRDRIFDTVEQNIPGAFVEVDAARGQLSVELPEGADPEASAQTLTVAFLSIGLQTTHSLQGNAPHAGGYHIPQPPIQMAMSYGRPAGGVRLSVFFISLICVALAVCVLTFSFSAFLFGGDLSLFGSDTLGTGDQEGEDYAGKIALIDTIFENYSLYDTDGQLLLDEMLRAYAAATGDDYAAYYTQEEFNSLMKENAGNGVGVGVMVVWDTATESIVIVQVMPDSPAANAGVLPGDRIITIGSKETGEAISDLGYDLAMQKMLGEIGSAAQFVVQRGEEQIEFSIVRAEFVSVSAQGRVSEADPRVGIVHISGFDTNTPAQFKAAMNDLIAKGCERFVFDVRNNPGGDQKSVTAVLSYFLTENDTVLSVIEKNGDTTYYSVEPVSYTGSYAQCSVAKEEIGMYRGYPLVVLTNGYTASAGELFTAALSEYELAVIVGTNTYGKGVIQTIFDLSQMGYSGGLKLTIGYYAPPSGTHYDKVGIAPDVEVALDASLAGKNLYLLEEQEDNQLLAAIEAVVQTES